LTVASRGKGAPGRDWSDASGDLEAFLRREIPLSRDMGVSVSHLDGEALELSAPLAPNLNHKRTAFGGSLYSLAVLAAWGTVRLILQDAGIMAHVVISEGGLSYLKPVTGEFRARCPRPPEAAAVAFRHALLRKGKGRIALRCEVREASAPEGEPAAVFTGMFAASRDGSGGASRTQDSSRGTAGGAGGNGGSRKRTPGGRRTPGRRA
jgi:thioesterase domain-containing protein